MKMTKVSLKLLLLRIKSAFKWTKTLLLVFGFKKFEILIKVILLRVK